MSQNIAQLMSAPDDGRIGAVKAGTNITIGPDGTICSTGGTGAITQIVAGANVTIDPPEGTGVVTINASGGGGGGGFWCQNSCGIYPSDLNYKVGIGTSSPANRFFVESGPQDMRYWMATAGAGAVPYSDQTYETYFNSVDVDPNGNVYSVGADGTNGIAYVTKFSSTGVVLWTQYFNAPTPSTWISADVVTYSEIDDSIIVGFSTSPRPGRGIFVKFDSLGNILWQQEISDTEINRVFSSIAVSSNGDIYLTGRDNYEAISFNTHDIFLFKVSSSGNLIWSKLISSPPLGSGGGGPDDAGYQVKLDNSGNVYLVGTLKDADVAWFTHGFILKLDSSGNTLWSKTFANDSSSYNAIDSVAFDSLGNIYIYTETGSYVNKSTLAKLDSSGNIIWQKSISGFNFYFGTLAVDSTDRLFLGGSSYLDSYGDCFTYLCADTSGTILWQNSVKTSQWDRTLTGWNGQSPLLFANNDYVVFCGFVGYSFGFIGHLNASGASFDDSYFIVSPSDFVIDTSTSLAETFYTVLISSATHTPTSVAIVSGTAPANFTISSSYPVSFTTSLNGNTEASDLYAHNFFVNGLPFGQSSAICGNFIVGKYAGTGEGGYCYNNQFIGTCSGQNELYGSYNTYIGECAGKGTPGPRVSSICEVITSTIFPPPYPYRGWFNYPFQAYTDSGALVEGWIERSQGEIRSWYLPIRSSFGPVQDGDTVTISGNQVGGVSGVDDVTISFYSEETGNESWATTFIGDGAGGESYGYSYYNVAIGNYAGQYTGVTGEFGQVFIGAYAGQRSFGGFYNLFIGSYAGQCAGGDASFSNVHIGTFAGAYAQDTFYQTFVGAYSGSSYQYGGGMEGPPNVFLGAFSGGSATTSCANTYVGTYSGLESCTGSYNSTLGAYSGKHIGSGSCNVSVGVDAGAGRWRIYYYDCKHLLTGYGNTSVGTYAGAYINDDSCLNTAIGFCAGQGHLSYSDPGNSSGCVYKNTSIGAYAGSRSICSSENFFGGYCAGAETCGVSGNVAIGSYAGYVGRGCYNTFLGHHAGAYNCWGSGNIAIGKCAGAVNTGCYNNFLGHQAGQNVTASNLLAGCYNNFLGKRAGQNACYSHDSFFAGRDAGRYASYATNSVAIGECAGQFGGWGNVFIGKEAGRYANNSYNNFLGYRSGKYNTSGSDNNFLGGYAGFHNTTGSDNNFLGRYAGGKNTTADGNNFFGYSAGGCNTTGCQNNFIGTNAGRLNTTGCYNNYIGILTACVSTTASENNFIGHLTGRLNTTGSCNQFIGRYAGGCNTIGDNNIAIGHCAGTDPVFTMGTTSNRIVLGNNAHTNAYIKVNWTVTSDERDKTCISTIQHGRDFLQKLEPIQYNWKDRETGEVTDAQPRFGFLAQEVLEAEGEPAILVDNQDPENLKLRESMMIPVLFKIIQEMDEELRALRSEVNDLKAKG